MLQKIRNKIQSKYHDVTISRKLVNADRNLKKPKSVFFYTTYKCASSFVSSLFNVLLKNSDYELINYEGVIYRLEDKLKLDIDSPPTIFLEKAITIK